MDDWWEYEPLADGGTVGEDFGPDVLLGEGLKAEGVEHGLDESAALADELFGDTGWSEEEEEW